ncbi:E3 ubiquitin-protein ligase TRIM9-like [Patella vulgata]|uniref:E3 ubiquitin-protein ligase TRIM9-like n=1 Tax=Patella vulgata TaxID=6465 RepID=UPI0024A951D3|nr:E3 ubiquitin-protein ligase TRIM9-like [Patella vulgata]
MSLCPEHKTENELYCKDCNRTICYNCIKTGHQGHTFRNVKDVESELKIILKQLKERVQTKTASNNSIVDSIKNEISTLHQQSDVECEKIDQRVEKMCQILQDGGEKLKLKIKDSNLEQVTMMTKMITDAEEQSRQMAEFGKQVGEMLNTDQLEELLNKTPQLKEAIRGIDTDFVVTDNACPRFQDAVIDVENLYKQIGQVHKKDDDRFECSFDVGNQYKYGETTRHEIQGVLWTLDCALKMHNVQQQGMWKVVNNQNVILRLVSPDVSCKANFTLKILNTKDDAKSVTEKCSHEFTNRFSLLHTPNRSEYIWKPQDPDYILKPENGFTNSDNKITIQVIFSSIEITSHIYEQKF